MAGGIQFEITSYGLKEAIDRSKLRSDRLKLAAIEMPYDLAMDFKDMLIPNTPSVTGDLVRSIKVISTGPNSAAVQITDPGASAVEHGHGDIYPKRAKELFFYWPRKGDWFATKHVNPVPGKFFVAQTAIQFRNGLKRILQLKTKKVLNI